MPEKGIIIKTMKLLALIGALAVTFAPSLFAQATLRAGDIVDIRLSGVPAEEIGQFSAQYTVDDAGMLNLPYINQVRAVGLAANQLQTSIQNKLMADEIYTHPTITVQVPQGGRFVSAGGSVRTPGRIPYTADLTLMSTINSAGGFNDFADKKKVRLVHDGKVRIIDARKILNDPSLDVKVFPGDQIDVPQSWF